MEQETPTKRRNQQEQFDKCVPNLIGKGGHSGGHERKYREKLQGSMREGRGRDCTKCSDGARGKMRKKLGKTEEGIPRSRKKRTL